MNSTYSALNSLSNGISINLNQTISSNFQTTFSEPVKPTLISSFPSFQVNQLIKDNTSNGGSNNQLPLVNSPSNQPPLINNPLANTINSQQNQIPLINEPSNQIQITNVPLTNNNSSQQTQPSLINNDNLNTENQTSQSN